MELITVLLPTEEQEISWLLQDKHVISMIRNNIEKLLNCCLADYSIGHEDARLLLIGEMLKGLRNYHKKPGSGCVIGNEDFYPFLNRIFHFTRMDLIRAQVKRQQIKRQAIIENVDQDSAHYSSLDSPMETLDSIYDNFNNLDSADKLVLRLVLEDPHSYLIGGQFNAKEISEAIGISPYRTRKLIAALLQKAK